MNSLNNPLNIVCLCPTYGRPSVVANAAACFTAQDYPAENRRLLIFDDAGQLAKSEGEHDGVIVMSSKRRRNSLPAKYDEMLRVVGDWADVFVVWDDDDVYLPWHVRRHAEALSGKFRWEREPYSDFEELVAAGEIPSPPAGYLWSQPERVYSTYTGKVGVEPSDGRFHGSLAMRRELLERVGGWVGVMPAGVEKRADFDQRMIAACQKSNWMRKSLRGHYHMASGPGYVYRWGDSGATHCSGLMRSPDNQDWYDRTTPCETVGGEVRLIPVFDRRTIEIYRECGAVIRPEMRTDGPWRNLEEVLASLDN